MHTLSSARRTCMASLSAVEWTATVAMPSSLQARSTRSAISPRLAMRTLSNIVRLFDDHERLREFDRLAVLDQNLLHRAGLRRGDGVHGLHGLDDQQRLSLADLLTDFNEGLRARLGSAVGRADHRRQNGARRFRLVGRRGAWRRRSWSGRR